MSKDKRLVEIWERGNWRRISFSALSKGNIFRLFEQGEGTRMEPVLNFEGGPWHRATSAPFSYKNEQEQYRLAIEAEPINKMPTIIVSE